MNLRYPFQFGDFVKSGILTSDKGFYLIIPSSNTLSHGINCKIVRIRKARADIVRHRSDKHIR